MRRIIGLALIAALRLLPCEPVQADTVPKVRSILQFGARIGSPPVQVDDFLWVGSLNDRGQISFTAETAAGGEALVQYSDGELTLIAAPGGDGPVGKWPSSNWFFGPVSMNQEGSIAFGGLLVKNGDSSSGGTFLWDYPLRKGVPVALPGMPAAEGRSFAWAGGATAVINNRDEIAFSASVKDASGKELPGIFLRSPTGSLQAVALPGQALPNGGKLERAAYPSLTDTGAVAFLARKEGDLLEYPYLWEKGTISALPTAGVSPPTGAFLLGFIGLWANNSGPSLLVNAHFHTLGRHTYPLYRLINGGAVPLAVPGQEMSGGGRLQDIQQAGVSLANDRGQHVLLARLQDGTMGAYRLDPSGELSLLLKTGMKTELGTITHLGENADSLGVGFNNKGEVALVVRIDRGAPSLVVVTPGEG